MRDLLFALISGVVGFIFGFCIAAEAGLQVGIERATCWAHDSTYVGTVKSGAVCGDGVVVPPLTPPVKP